MLFNALPIARRYARSVPGVLTLPDGIVRASEKGLQADTGGLGPLGDIRFKPLSYAASVLGVIALMGGANPKAFTRLNPPPP